MATEPLGPADPGAQDECATCGHVRWTHDNPGVAGLCPSFVELSYGTRMARFVEAAQGLSLAMVGVRAAMTEAFRATNRFHTAMQQAGLLPEDDPNATIPEAVGKHTRDAAVATLAEALDVPAEMLTGPSLDGLPDHWTDAAPLRQPTDWHTVGCDKRCGGTCMGLAADPHPIGSGPTEHHHPAEADPEATQTIPAVESPEPSGKQPARLWSWDAGTGGWVQIDSGPAELLAQGRDRRYQAAANYDIPGAAWLVRAPGDKPTGHPDLLGVPTT